MGRVTICHYEPYKGIRASAKQAYAEISDRRREQATRADKSIRALNSWEHQQEPGEKVTESYTLNVMQEQDGRGKR